MRINTSCWRSQTFYCCVFRSERIWKRIFLFLFGDHCFIS